MAWRLPALKAEAKTVKAMKTPAAEENMKARRASAAKVDASQITLIRIEDPANACVLDLTSSISYCEILQRLQPKHRLRLHSATIHGHECVHTATTHGDACEMTTK